MSQATETNFNLWSQSWITVERQDGKLLIANIESILLNATDYRSLYDPSPLVIVGIHRLLVAILQDIFNIKDNVDLEGLWHKKYFPPEKIKEFGEKYKQRFELFSKPSPFLQSADLPMVAEKNQNNKPVVYLFPEIPSATGITHFAHGLNEGYVICPACAAKGLLTLPSFSTTGGAGIKPSINGVPPIYLIPCGDSLFESLTSSLVQPYYFPKTAEKGIDNPWWKRDVPIIIQRGQEVIDTGYLESLTFPARRVRLHPLNHEAICSRCGQNMTISINSMVFEMGFERPKSLISWQFDPFVAYHENNKLNKEPTPIRPREGIATWREFSSLFIKSKGSIRPGILDQYLGLNMDHDQFLTYVCIGMRTDMKAKVFEWIRAEFNVPKELMKDDSYVEYIGRAFNFANESEQIISKVFLNHLNRERVKTKKYKTVQLNMIENFWGKLSIPFREFILYLPEEKEAACIEWAETVYQTAMAVYQNAVQTINDKAINLELIINMERVCNAKLKELLQKERANG